MALSLSRTADSSRHLFLKRCGLYTGQVVCRKSGYPPNKDAQELGKIYSYDMCSRPVPMTMDLLQKVRKLTLNFMSTSEDENAVSCEPHLHAFICFLTFQKRPKKDAMFMKWIKEHYIGKTVQDATS